MWGQASEVCRGGGTKARGSRYFHVLWGAASRGPTTWGSPTKLWLGTKKQTIFVLPQPGPNSAKAAWWGVASRALGVPLCEWGGLSGPTAELLQRPRDSVVRKEPGAYCDTPSNPSAITTPSTRQSQEDKENTAHRVKG